MKVGDVLEVVTNAGKITAPVGSLCTVTSLSSMPEYITVKWHEGFGHHQTDGAYYPSHFKLYEEQELGFLEKGTDMTHKIKRISNDVIEKARKYAELRGQRHKLTEDAVALQAAADSAGSEANLIASQIQQGVQPFYTPSVRTFVINLDGVSIVVSRDFGVLEAQAVKEEKGTPCTSPVDSVDTTDGTPF